MAERDLNSKRVLSGATAIIRLSDIEAKLQELESDDAVLLSGSVEQVPEETVDIAPGGDENLHDKFGLSTRLDDSQATCRVLAFFGAKGGAGTTSLAINCASVAASQGHSVLLVDMDLQLGAACDSLGLKSQRSLAQAAKMVGRGEDISGFPFVKHESGVHVIDQPDLAELDALTADSLPRVFAAFRRQFDFIVIDGLRDFTDHAIVSLDQADRVAVVFTQDVPAIRGAIKSLALFRRLGYGAGSMTLVMNRYKKTDAATLDAVEAALGARVDWFMPDDFDTAHNALNRGVTVTQTEPDTKLGQTMVDFGRFLTGMPPLERKKSLFAKMFGRSK